MTLTTMPKVGDKVRYLQDDYCFMTKGGIYEIVSIAPHGQARYKDDEGDILRIDKGDFFEFELVTEATPQPAYYVRLNSFRLDSDGSYDVNLATDAAGFEAVQRMVIESSRQSDRVKLEIQIAQLQRKLEALK